MGKRRTGLPAVLLTALTFLFPAKGMPMADFDRTVLANGLVVLVSEDHSLPFVTIRAVVDAGSWRDETREAGLANLTATGLSLGTRDRTAGQINETIDFLGASLDSSCNRDFASVSLRILRKNLEAGFAVFRDILLHPAFPEDEVRRAKTLILGRIRALKGEPGAVAERVFHQHLMPDSSYGQPVKGTEKTVSALSREDIERFHDRWYHPGNAILAVVGDITPDEVSRVLTARLQEWKRKDAAPEDFQAVYAESSRTVVTDRDISQANIVLGHKGIVRTNRDYHAVTVMNHILGGGGFGSRLMQAIRVQRGLAYSVYSRFSSGKRAGFFRISLQTSNATAGEAIRIALDAMHAMRREKVSETELETSRKYLIGNFPLRLTTQAAVSAFISRVEYYGLGMDYRERYPDLIREVDREDVLSAARTYCHPDQVVVSVVGRETAVRDSLEGKL